MKIVIADDEQSLLNFLHRGLVAEGFECIKTNQYDDIIPLIKAESPRVAVLDRMFADRDSVGLLPKLKALPTPPMILLLTAVDDITERVAGLDQGADDYLCKPFDFDELIARINALGRRNMPSTTGTPKQLKLANVWLDLDGKLAYIDTADAGGQELQLTKIEYGLLHYFMESPNKVLSRERILSRVWQSHSDPMTNVVDVYISRLRQKLSNNSGLEIQTMRGNGYRMRPVN